MVDGCSRFFAHTGSAVWLIFWLAVFLFLGLWPVNDNAISAMTNGDWQAEAMSRFVVMAAWTVVATLGCLVWNVVYLFPLRFEKSRFGAWWTAGTAVILLAWAVCVAIRFNATRPFF